MIVVPNIQIFKFKWWTGGQKKTFINCTEKEKIEFSGIYNSPGEMIKSWICDQSYYTIDWILNTFVEYEGYDSQDTYSLFNIWC